jgi:type I restriction enzyme S subunit
MSAKLKPYSEYKDSGVPWLGQVPEQWPVLPNRALFAEIKDREHPDEQMLSVTITQGVIRQKTLLSNSSKKDSSNEDRSAYKLVCPSDLAYNKMRGWQGAVGVSDLRGIVSPAYVVMRLREHNVPRYFHHLYRTPHFAKEAERWSYGITSDMWSLRPEHFKMIYAPVPPPNEQEAIVRFVDRVNSWLERTIRIKQNLIKLLEEQKQTIIDRIVTRGLDADAHFKPSGMEWLGAVPSHWEVLRAKYLFREVDERSVDGTEELLSVSHITGVTPRSEKNITMFKAASYVGHKLCRPGDLVINTMWAWMAALGVSKYTGIISPSYAVYRPTNPARMFGEFVNHLLRTRSYVSEYICRSTGIRLSRLRLYPEKFFEIPILVPPIEEQKKMMTQVSRQTVDLNTVITRREREISLLREYRTRLIADVVTGKLDVRGVELPALAGEEVVEDSDEIIETESDIDAELVAETTNADN